MLAYWAQPLAEARHGAVLLERMKADEQADALRGSLRRAVERRMRLVQRELDEVRPRAEAELERLWAEAKAIRREVERLVEDAAAGRDVEAGRSVRRIKDEAERILRQAAQTQAESEGKVRELVRDMVGAPAEALGLGVPSPPGPRSVVYRPYLEIFDRWSTQARGQIIRTAEALRLGQVTRSEAIAELGTAVDAPRWQAKSLLRTGIGTMQSTETQARLDELGERTTGLRKRWSATIQRNTRWYHLRMNGVSVPHDKPFRVPSPKGGVDLLMFPLDPSAPVWQTRNCRCASVPEVGDLALQ